MVSLATVSFLLVVFIVATRETVGQDANQGKGIRVFKYAHGRRYLTNVAKEPDVEEVTNW